MCRAGRSAVPGWANAIGFLLVLIVFVFLVVGAATVFSWLFTTLGLVRSVPPARDTAARQQRAFDTIRAFGGTYEVEDSSAGRPVVPGVLPCRRRPPLRGPSANGSR